MMSRRFFLLLLLLVPTAMLMGATVVRADDEVDEGTEEDVVVPAGDADDAAATGDDAAATTESDEEAVDPTQGIDAKVIFPGHADLKFAAGELAVALIGFKNGGSQDVTVEVIEGSLRYPQDVKFYVQNFTRVGYREKVAPNSEATFLYRFRPHESFDPRDFHFVLNAIFSTGEEQYFSVSPFNSTIAVVDAESTFEPKKLFNYVFIVAGLVFAAVYILQNRTKKSSSSSRAPAPKIETGTKDTADNEWLENMNVPAQRSPKPKSPKPKAE